MFIAISLSLLALVHTELGGGTNCSCAAVYQFTSLTNKRTKQQQGTPKQRLANVTSDANLAEKLKSQLLCWHGCKFVKPYFTLGNYFEGSDVYHRK